MGRTLHQYLIFDTAGGFCGIAWNSVGVTRFQLPTRECRGDRAAAAAPAARRRTRQHLRRR